MTGAANSGGYLLSYANVFVLTTAVTRTPLVISSQKKTRATGTPYSEPPNEQ